MSEHCCLKEQILNNPCQAIEDGDLNFGNYITYGFTPWAYALLIAQCGTTGAIVDLTAVAEQILACCEASRLILIDIEEDTTAIDIGIQDLITLVTEGNATQEEILAVVEAILVESEAINANTDQIEALLNTIITVLNTIDANTDDLEVLVATGNATLLLIDANLDAIEALITAGNLSLASIDACCAANNLLLASIDATLTAMGALITNLDTNIATILANQIDPALFGTHTLVTGTEAAVPVAGTYSSYVIVRTGGTGDLHVDGINLTGVGDSTAEEAQPQFKIPAPVIVVQTDATYEWRTKS